MNVLLDRFYKDLEHEVKVQVKEYHVKFSELNSSLFVLVKRRRGKILGEKNKFLFDSLERISKEIYKKYAEFSKVFEHKFFPYFKLVKSYGSYHFHFLVVKKDYGK